MSDAYIVRAISTKEAVGIFFVESLWQLPDLVDQVCQPQGCERARLPFGGFEFSNGCPSFPFKVDENGEPNPCSFMSIDGFWHNVFFDGGKKMNWKPLEERLS